MWQGNFPDNNSIFQFSGRGSIKVPQNHFRALLEIDVTSEFQGGFFQTGRRVEEPPGVWSSPVAVWRRGGTVRFFVYWQSQRKGCSPPGLDPHWEKRPRHSGFPGVLAGVCHRVFPLFLQLCSWNSNTHPPSQSSSQPPQVKSICRALLEYRMHLSISCACQTVLQLFVSLSVFFPC